jgi:hypothetical protein
VGPVVSTLCPVCGFDLGFPAWKGNSPSNERCPSCGIEFGFHDWAKGEPSKRAQVYEDWRRRWIAGGMKWHSRGRKPPDGWDAARQLQAIGMDPAG